MSLNNEQTYKYSQLTLYLQKLKKPLIAFSGGVDSTFLLSVAHRVLGDQITAVTAISPFFPRREADESAKFCAHHHIRHLQVKFDPLAIEAVRKNVFDRCYHCKYAMFTLFCDYAKAHECETVLEGTNWDDSSEDRPGMRAIQALHVESPLRMCGFTKAEIRELSSESALPTADKPALACLATRFSPNDPIDVHRLHRVEQAEQCLFDLGFKQVRVRVYGDLARIELDVSQLEKMVDSTTRLDVIKTFKNLGFLHIALDLEGYRTGSVSKSDRR